MDDLDAQLATSGKSAAELWTAGSDNTSSAQAEMRQQDPRVALPQDPIPVYEGKPTGPAGPRQPR